MIEINSYDFQEHLHRYAVWTAARAQRAFLNNAHISKAIEKVNLKQEAFSLPHNYKNEEFDKWHSQKTIELQRQLQVFSKIDMPFSRAAKVLNVYLKTTLVIPNCSSGSSLVNAIHPPIDRILLNCLIENEFLFQEHFTAWTKMNESQYKKIIEMLRKNFTSLWKAECCWKPPGRKTKY